MASSISPWIGERQPLRRGWGVCWWGYCWPAVCCCWRGGVRRGGSCGWRVRGGSWDCCGWAGSAIRPRRSPRPDGSACPLPESGYALATLRFEAFKMITATTNSAAPCSAPCIAAAAIARALAAANDQTLSLTPAAPRRSTPAWARIFAPAPGNIWTKATFPRRPTRRGDWLPKRSRPSAPTTVASSTTTGPFGW